MAKNGGIWKMVVLGGRTVSDNYHCLGPMQCIIRGLHDLSQGRISNMTPLKQNLICAK